MIDMSLNVVTMMGRLVADPELRTTTGGTEVVSFRIAVDRPFSKDANAQKADFFTVIAWNSTALFVSRYFSKGSPIAITGKLQSRTYEDRNSGEKKTSIEIVASEVSFCGNKNEGSAPSTPTIPNNPPTNSTGSYTPSYTNTTSGFSTASPSDFEEIEDDDEMPPF